MAIIEYNNKKFNIPIIYEDNHLIVVEKPIGVLSQEDHSGDPDLLNIIKEYIRVEYNKPGAAWLGLVHRLDRPVGGLMVLALVTCIFIGFIAPPLADICLKFHQGFTLHNVGFLAGFVGITIYSLINILALEFDRHNIIKNNTVPELKIFLGIYFLFILILGFYLTRKIGEIGRLLKNSGYNIVFLDTFGTGTIFINMGVMV